MELIDIEKHIVDLVDRVNFLKDWLKHLQSLERKTEAEWRNSNLTDNFERQDKIFSLKVEIEAKESLINQRQKDMIYLKKAKAEQEKKVLNGYPALVKKLEGVQTGNEEVDSLIAGILERNAKGATIEEKVRDYSTIEKILKFEANLKEQAKQMTVVPTMKAE